MLPFLLKAIKALPGAFKFGPLDDALMGRALAPRLGMIKTDPKDVAKLEFVKRLEDDVADILRDITPSFAMTKRGRILEPFEDMISASARSGDEAQLFRDNLVRNMLAKERARAPVPLPTLNNIGGPQHPLFSQGTNVGSGYNRLPPALIGLMRGGKLNRVGAVGKQDLGDLALNKMMAPFNMTSSPRSFVDDIALTGTPMGRGAGRGGLDPVMVMSRGYGQPVTRQYPPAFHPHLPRLSTGMRSTDARTIPDAKAFSNPQFGVTSRESYDIIDPVLARQQLAQTINRSNDLAQFNPSVNHPWIT